MPGEFVPFHQTIACAGVRASYSRALHDPVPSTEPDELSAVPQNNAATQQFETTHFGY
jgi:hypothetical protein